MIYSHNSLVRRDPLIFERVGKTCLESVSDLPLLGVISLIKRYTSIIKLSVTLSPTKVIGTVVSNFKGVSLYRDSKVFLPCPERRV